MTMIHLIVNHGYDSRHDFNRPLGIITMIHISVNHGYDSRHDFNKPIGIMTMIHITVNQVMIPDMILTHQLTS